MHIGKEVSVVGVREAGRRGEEGIGHERTDDGVDAGTVFCCVVAWIGR